MGTYEVVSTILIQVYSWSQNQFLHGTSRSDTLFLFYFSKVKSDIDSETDEWGDKSDEVGDQIKDDLLGKEED